MRVLCETFRYLQFDYHFHGNGFTPNEKDKAINRQYPAEIITDADDADDRELLATTLFQALSSENYVNIRIG